MGAHWNIAQSYWGLQIFRSKSGICLSDRLFPGMLKIFETHVVKDVAVLIGIFDGGSFVNFFRATGVHAGETVLELLPYLFLVKTSKIEVIKLLFICYNAHRFPISEYKPKEDYDDQQYHYRDSHSN